MQHSPGGLAYANAPNVVPTPDAIDRQKELLCSAVDSIQSQTELLRRIFDRSLGSVPSKPSDTPPSPPYDVTSVNDWLGNLERSCRDLSNQVARVREQLP